MKLWSRSSRCRWVASDEREQVNCKRIQSIRKAWVCSDPSKPLIKMINFCIGIWAVRGKRDAVPSELERGPGPVSVLTLSEVGYVASMQPDVCGCQKDDDDDRLASGKSHCEGRRLNVQSKTCKRRICKGWFGKMAVCLVDLDIFGTVKVVVVLEVKKNANRRSKEGEPKNQRQNERTMKEREEVWWMLECNIQFIFKNSNHSIPFHSQSPGPLT